MKKWTALLIALVMTVLCAAAFAEEEVIESRSGSAVQQ